MYSADAFQVPDGFSLPYYQAVTIAAGVLSDHNFDPYSSTVQSQNLRVIELTLDPTYKAKSDLVQFNADYNVTPQFTFTSQTGLSNDFLYATQDYNRFNTTPGLFHYDPNSGRALITPEGEFCDPQFGCSDRLVAQDLVKEHAWQLNQEFRLASHFEGPLNFSLGANYLHYETAENYYVFINSLTIYATTPVFGGAKPR